MLRRLAFGFEQGFDLPEAANEFCIGATQRVFGVNLQVTPEIGDNEKQIAIFFRDLFPARVFKVRRVFQLADFFADLVEHRLHGRPVEADAGRLVLELDRADQRGQGQRHARKHAFIAKRIPGFLLGFHALPEVFRIKIRLLFIGAEHVRVTADHFIADARHNIIEGEMPVFLGHPGVVDDLQKQIAKLVAQLIEIGPRDGVGHLVSFLDGVGSDGLKCLLHVPRTPGLGRAQSGHDFEQAGYGFLVGRSGQHGVQSNQLSDKLRP